MSKKDKQPDQEVYIWPPSEGSGRQEVYVNPPGGRPPHEARGTAHLVIVLAVAAFLVIISCGVASALTAGAIW